MPQKSLESERAFNARALGLFMAIILNWNADSCPKELRSLPQFPHAPLPSWNDNGCCLMANNVDGNAMSADGYA